MRLSRDVLERWVDQVYFEDTVVDCFVRMTMASKDLKREYRMCQVVSITVVDAIRIGRSYR